MLSLGHKISLVTIALITLIRLSANQALATNATILGLHTGNINAGTTADADRIISNLSNMGVRSVRLVYQYPSTNTVTAYAIKALNAKGIDVLLTIMPHSSDYSDPSTSYSDYPNGSTAFEQLCGSPGWKWMYKYSTVDQNLYKARLESLLIAINQVGGRVAAFEIGNEADWACFNGDIPVIETGDPTNPYDLSRTDYLSGTVRGYAKTLKTSYQSMKSHQPGASVLTFGAANTYLYDSKKPHISFSNFLLWLTNIDGINYLTSYSDATAMHFYPQVITTTEIANTIGPAFTNVAQYRNKFWITEFGFGKTLPQYLANPATVEQSRLASYHRFMDALNSLNQVVVERAYLYSYEPGIWSIMQTTNTPLLSAQIFKEYQPVVSPSPIEYPSGDLTHDGLVNIYDFNLLISKFGNPYTIYDFNNIVSNFGR
ncbi:MAG: hypothetical protein E6R05_05575 [Candidatus Moraniibacteriota bacterium]|nr:MAG: hypothetical protein E6R05_05575 [Candidatus Moranbacteria bacterium]